ncbi:DUF6168 family protein [Maribacter sp. TH_r10]|uniref:DUF6168 family protein n=1 Tax=Maribacter sp. TH_r10 TaxID=3082086 RepID=UPI0029538A46|nr:DUF6168 family protein [Maribacter sp. TH_r10]MDV7137562.1 DUF6168 family protein [Maribacter sp. TH_r10]|tara:strand:- start:2035 stop:2430 length:396 start_codon:yes stop_codon:yes gene_type:complete
MAKVNPIVQFILSVAFSLGAVFLIHLIILDNLGFPKFNDLIGLSYIVNGLLAIAIFVSIYIFRSKLKNQIGFLFMGGSFLKFLFFFILFYPAYKSDGEMSRLEFAAFFVPYVVSLVVETIFTAQILKKWIN